MADSNMIRELEDRIETLERQMKEIAPIIAALSRDPGAMMGIAFALAQDEKGKA